MKFEVEEANEAKEKLKKELDEYKREFNMKMNGIKIQEMEL